MSYFYSATRFQLKTEQLLFAHMVVYFLCLDLIYCTVTKSVWFMRYHAIWLVLNSCYQTETYYFQGCCDASLKIIFYMFCD